MLTHLTSRLLSVTFELNSISSLSTNEQHSMTKDVKQKVKSSLGTFDMVSKISKTIQTRKQRAV